MGRGEGEGEWEGGRVRKRTFSHEFRMNHAALSINMTRAVF